VGVTGLRFSTLRNNWDSAYQRTNNAGIPAPDGAIYWDFEYVAQAILLLSQSFSFFPADFLYRSKQGQEGVSFSFAAHLLFCCQDW
jgi:hypothetical protein